MSPEFGNLAVLLRCAGIRAASMCPDGGDQFVAAHAEAVLDAQLAGVAVQFFVGPIIVGFRLSDHGATLRGFGVDDSRGLFRAQPALQKRLKAVFGGGWIVPAHVSASLASKQRQNRADGQKFRSRNDLMSPVVGRARAQIEEVQMKIGKLMTRDVVLAEPDWAIKDAAAAMATVDCGFIPVRENDRLVGTITDRDIAIRAVAEGKGPETKVRDVMSKEVKYCFEDEDVGDVARNMADIQVRRLPVLNREKRLVGVVSLGDLAIAGGAADDDAEIALTGISEPRHMH
jgi:CBS domain-containing protein